MSLWASRGLCLPIGLTHSRPERSQLLLVTFFGVKPWSITYLDPYLLSPVVHGNGSHAEGQGAPASVRNLHTKPVVQGH